MPEEIRADLLLGRDTLSPGLVKAGQAASDASSNVRQLTRDLYEAGKVRATPVVDLNDKDATAKLADVTAKLKDLGAKVADPGVDLKDKEAVAGLTAMQVKLDALGKKVASPRITLEGLARAEAGIAALDLQMERFGKKFAGGGGGPGFLRRLLPGGGAGAGSILRGAGGLAGLAGTGLAAGGATPYLYGAAGLAAALLAPALLPLGLGALVGGGAAGGALALGAKGAPLLQADRQALARAQAAISKGPGTASQQLTLQLAQQKLAHDQGLYGEFVPLHRTFSALGQSALGVFSGALEQGGPAALGPNGRPIPGSGAPSFLTGLTGILKQLGGFIQTLGPELAKMFRASLPFIQVFVKFLEQAAKTLLPVFVRLLEQMTPVLPIISKGLLNIVQGFAGFLKAIGPSGMEASAKIFVVATKGMAAILVALGHTINWLTEHVPTWAHNIAAWWDRLRHDTAASFDSTRKFILTYAHDVVAVFNWLSRAAGSAWNILWDGIKRAAHDGIGVVTGWFGDWPAKILHVLGFLTGKLYDLGKTWLNSLWSGLKNVFGSVWSWFKSLPSKLLNAIGIHSPPDWAIEAGKHIMGGILHGITSRKDELLQRFAAISGGMGSVAGRLTGPTAGVQALMQRIAATYGWTGSQWNALNAVEMREAGYKLDAQNPTSPAYGLAQFIKGPSEYYQWGGNPNTAAGQIVAMLNYIRSTYGSPAGAWQHELNYGWYDRGGLLPPGLTLAYNATGRAEQVIPGGGGGQTVVINVQLGHGTHPVAAAQEIAKILNVGARNGVRLRTSILGPG